ncbi:MAG TPA: tyrosine--tRNA ligase [Thermomicrobiales bacterium]|nr:tyrosine--tRNA ligase [Thermomicrobiales bacterium]
MVTETLTGQTPTSTTDAIQLARAAGVNPLEYLRSRGYVHDISDEEGLRAAFEAGPVTAYIGFDPSATSLHVGNLLGIMMLGVLQRFGHRPIALGGGGTALVGDPSGKTSARMLISPEDIERNLAGVLPQFARYLDFEAGRFGDNPPALLLNNADWLLPLHYIDFLREIGRHFSVNEMLAAETYKVRLETIGLNFVEFNYRLVQAYDFLHLYRAEGCILQMGGSDQWGNILAGVDLVRKADGGKAFALVSPLITTADGQKMGKSEGNAVWLDPERTAPYDYYQYWVNVEDADVPCFLRLFTFLPEDRIAELTSVPGAALREAKYALAHEATSLTHGEQAASEARDAARSLFAGANRAPSATDASLPTTEITAADVEAGISLADVFVRAGLAKSRGEARRLATQGGLSLDDQRVEDIDAPFQPEADSVLLRAGKKRYRRVVVG